MQEKGNVMRRAAFLTLFPLITSCIGGGEENFFCDSYHFSLWIKHVVMGSLFFTSLQNYLEILIVSVRDLLRNMEIE